MASLQQSPFTLHTISTPSSLKPRPRVLSFSRHVSGIRIPAVALKGARRSRGGASGARMAESAANSYATALADVATGNDTLEATVADIEKVEKIFSEPEVYDFFANPTVDLEKKQKVIDEIAETSSLLPHVANFLNVLLDTKRIEMINEIVKEFEVVYNTLTDTQLAIVTSVVKLESQHLAQIAKGVQRLTGAKNVRIKTVIDPSLVAGFTIRFGNSGSKLVDFSVKKQLADIAAQLEMSDLQLAA